MATKIYRNESGAYVAVNTALRRPLRLAGDKAEQIVKKIKNKDVSGLDDNLLEILQEYQLLPGKSSKIEEDAPWANSLDFPLEEVTLYLLLTYSCNGDCIYCFEKTNNDLSLNVKALKLKHAIDAIQKSAKIAKKVRVVFFGGEPLLQPDLLVKILESIPKNENITYSVTTNLTYLPESIISAASEYNVGFLTSIDGPSGIHELQRPLRAKRPYFYDVIDNIKKLNRAGVVVDVRTTVTGINLPYVMELVSFLREELKLTRINLPPLSIFKSDGELVDLKMLPDPALYIKTLYDLITTKRILPTNLHPVDSMARNFLTGYQVKAPCGMAKGHVIELDPDGFLWPCSYMLGDKSYCLGHIDDENVLSRNWVRGNYQKLYPISCTASFEHCVGCELQKFCGGGCAIPWMRCEKLKGKKKQQALSYSKAIYCGIAKISFEIMSKYFTEEAYKGNIGVASKKLNLLPGSENALSVATV